VVAHLDQNRRNALFSEILDLGAQAWLTGTDVALFEGLIPHAQLRRVEGGRIA
jgi:DNA replication and repair protein RecF